MSFQGLNKVFIVGYVSAEPETRETAGGKLVTNFSVPTSFKKRDGEESTEWHNVVAWGKTAEIVQSFVRKGTLLHVEGRLQTQKWEDSNGNKRSKTEIVADRILLLGKPPAQQEQQAQPSGGAVVEDDEDLPF